MRYLIIEKDLGLFLGVYQGVFIFAKGNVFPIVKAPSFDSEQDAEYYIAKYFPKGGKTYGVIKVESKDKYVGVADILKAGYKEYTHEMIDFIPMISGAIH